MFVDGYIDEEIERIKVVAGLELAQPPAIGVYHYRQTDAGAVHESTCSVIANHLTKVYIHTTHDIIIEWSP